MTVPLEIVFCYAHRDEAFLKKLQAHLKPLHHQGEISTWYDRDISPGADYDADIKEHLASAQLIILLISPDFLASDYCYNVELKHALARHNCQEAKVVPVILRPCAWKQTDVGKLQALPTDGKPIANWQNQDEAFLNIFEGISQVVNSLHKQAESQEAKNQQKTDFQLLAQPVRQRGKVPIKRIWEISIACLVLIFLIGGASSLLINSPLVKGNGLSSLPYHLSATDTKLQGVEIELDNPYQQPFKQFLVRRIILSSVRLLAGKTTITLRIWTNDNSADLIRSGTLTGKFCHLSADNQCDHLLDGGSARFGILFNGKRATNPYSVALIFNGVPQTGQKWDLQLGVQPDDPNYYPYPPPIYPFDDFYFQF